MLPNGMFPDVYGPFSGRRHDAYLLRESRINERLAAAQVGSPIPYRVYGDAAYPVLSHVDRGFRGGNLTLAQKEYSKDISRVRMSTVLGFGKVVQEFPIVDFRKNLKLFLQPIGKYYITADLLVNAHTRLYSSLTGVYFNAIPPEVEHYFG
ncbi:unnamed protein product [Discosporangium mesarthrocarpum]